MVEHLRGAAARFVLGNTIEPRHVEKIFPCADVVVEAGILRQVADALFYFQRLVRRVEAANRNFARGGLGEAEQHEDRRRFPGAVGAEKAEDFAFLDRQAERVYREFLTVALA